MNQEKHEGIISFEPLLAFTPNAEKNVCHSQESSSEKKEINSNADMEQTLKQPTNNTNKSNEAQSSGNSCRYEIDNINDVNIYLKSNYERTLSYLEEENKILKNHIIESEIIRIEKEKLESMNVKLSSENVHMGKKIECLLSENKLLRDCVGNLEKKLGSYNNLVNELEQLRVQVAKEKNNVQDSNNLQQIVKTVTSQRDALSLQLLQQKELAENSLRQKSNELIKQKEICDKLLVLTNQLYSQNEHLQNVLFVLSNTKEFYRKCCYMKLEHLHGKLFDSESTKCLLSDKRFDLSLRKVKMILHVVEYFREINLPPSQINLLMKAVHTALLQLSGEMEDLSQSLCKAFDYGDCHDKNLLDQTSRTFSNPDISGKTLRIDSSKSIFFSPKNMLMALCPDDKTLVERLFSSEEMQMQKSTANEGILEQSWFDELEKENQNLKLILANTNKEVEQLNNILSEKRKTLGKYQECLTELKSEIETIYDTHAATSDNCGNQDRNKFLGLDKERHKSFKRDSPSEESQDQSRTESEFLSLQKIVSSLKFETLNMLTTESKLCERISVKDQNKLSLEKSCEEENDVVCPEIKSSQQEMLEHCQPTSHDEQKLDERQGASLIGKHSVIEESETKPRRIFSPKHLSMVSPSRVRAQKSVSFRLTDDLHCILKKLVRFPTFHQIFCKTYPTLLSLFSNFQITIKPIRDSTNNAMMFVNLDEFKDKEVPSLLMKISQTYILRDFRIFFSKYSEEKYLCVFAPLTVNIPSKTFSINVDSSLSLKLPMNNSDFIFAKLSRSSSCGKHPLLHTNQSYEGRNSLPHMTFAKCLYSDQNRNHAERTSEVINSFDDVSARAITSNEFYKLKVVPESETAVSNQCNASSTIECASSQEISRTASQNSSKNPVHEVSKYSLVVRTPSCKSVQEKGINTQLRKLVSQLKLNPHDHGISESSGSSSIRICDIKILLLSLLQQYLSSFMAERNTLLNPSILSSFILSKTNESRNAATAIQPRYFSRAPEMHSDLVFSVLGVVESINDMYSSLNEHSNVQEMNLISSVARADLSVSSRLLCDSPQTSQEEDDCPLTQIRDSSDLLTSTEVLCREICESCSTYFNGVSPKSIESASYNSMSSSALRQSRAVPKIVKFSKKNWFTEINILRLKIHRIRRQFMKLKLEYSNVQKLEHPQCEENLKTLNETSVGRNEAENISRERYLYEQKVADLQQEILTLRENLNILSKTVVKVNSVSESQLSPKEEETNVKEEITVIDGCRSQSNKFLMPKDVSDSSSESKLHQEPTIAVKDVREEKESKSEEDELSKTLALKSESRKITELQSSYEQEIANLKKCYEDKLIQLKSSHNKDFKALSQIYVEKLKVAEEIYSQSIDNTEETNLHLLKEYQNIYSSKLIEWETLMDQFSRTLLNLQKIIYESEEKYSAELSAAVNKYETLLRLVSEEFDNEKVNIQNTLCESLKKFEAEYKENLKAIMEHLNNEAAFSRRLIIKELDCCKKQYESSLKKQQHSYKSLLEEAKKSYERKQSQRSLHLSFSKVLNYNCDHPEDSPSRSY